MKKFNIVNNTNGKIVLNGVNCELPIDAAGKYISVLFIAGIISHCDKDIQHLGDSSFKVLTKGWEMQVVEV